MAKTTIALEARNTAPKTPAEQLREILGDIEVRLGRMGVAGSTDAAQIPDLFDQAMATRAELESFNIDVSAEMSRLDSLADQYLSKGRKFLATIGGVGALRQARESVKPPAEAWWWFIDQHLDRQAREAWRRTAKSFLIAGGVFAVIAAIYLIFLQPDKATRLRLQHQTAAEQLMDQGDFTAALAEIRLALDAEPANGELWAYKGVLEDSLGMTNEAAASFEAALSYSGNLPDYLAARIQAYQYSRRYDAALSDAEQLLALEPESARAYLMRASAQVSLGQTTEAYLSYEAAAKYAAAADQPELEGIARVQMAYLMQGMISQTAPTTTPDQ